MVPKKLYKYRRFDIYTLRCLSCAGVFYAHPDLFNDPLDSNPSIDVDVDLSTLEKVCFSLVEKRRGKGDAQRAIKNHRYSASQHGCLESGDTNAEKSYRFLLAYEVKRQLVDEYKHFGVPRQLLCPV